MHVTDETVRQAWPLRQGQAESCIFRQAQPLLRRPAAWGRTFRQARPLGGRRGQSGWRGRASQAAPPQLQDPARAAGSGQLHPVPAVFRAALSIHCSNCCSTVLQTL